MSHYFLFICTIRRAILTVNGIGKSHKLEHKAHLLKFSVMVTSDIICNRYRYLLHELSLRRIPGPVDIWNTHTHRNSLLLLSVNG